MDSLYSAKNVWPMVYKRIEARLKNKDLDDWHNLSINSDTYTVEIDGTRLRLFNDKCVITHRSHNTIMYNTFNNNVESVAEAAVNAMLVEGKRRL